MLVAGEFIPRQFRPSSPKTLGGNFIATPAPPHPRTPAPPEVPAPPEDPAPPESPQRLRDRWPFLNEPGTPVELQALVTQRITRYHEYSELYPQLRNCTDFEQCASVAGRLVDAYMDNQAIFREMEHYARHRKVLGHHPMLRHFQQLTRLRSSSTKELVQQLQQTRDNIWRVQSELKKGDKPHLAARRLQKLEEYKLRLQEINRLLE